MLSLSQINEVLELKQDYHENRSMLMTGQVPIQQWRNAVGDLVLSDATNAVLDRLLHNAHWLLLKSESMRRLLAD